MLKITLFALFVLFIAVTSVTAEEEEYNSRQERSLLSSLKNAFGVAEKGLKKIPGLGFRYEKKDGHVFHLMRFQTIKMFKLTAVLFLTALLAFVATSETAEEELQREERSPGIREFAHNAKESVKDFVRRVDEVRFGGAVSPGTYTIRAGISGRTRH